ncbi:unnamed protein product [Rotaria socialis]|nr:unnamed protein product [Rotaria socialis]
MCYNVSSATWELSNLPFPNWGGVSLRARGEIFITDPLYSACNELLIPKLSKLPPSEQIHWVTGTSVMSCIWVNFFGHIFIEMMLPAWMAWRKLADHFYILDKNVSYVLDNRCRANTAASSFSLLSSRPILQLAELVNETRLRKKSHTCFEQLVIGYRLQSSLQFPHNVAHLESRDVVRYRDYIKTLHGLPLQVNMSTGECIALLLQRNYSRRILDKSEKEIVTMLRERTLCTVKIATFDGISILEQVRLVASATIFIHVSGSGSHHFIWLSDGAASLTLAHPHLGLHVIGNGGIGGGGMPLNDLLCWKHPTVLCVTAATRAIKSHYSSDVEVDTYSFSIALDMIKVWQHRGKFDPRDPSE